VVCVRWLVVNDCLIFGKLDLVDGSAIVTHQQFEVLSQLTTLPIRSILHTSSRTIARTYPNGATRAVLLLYSTMTL